ncbi:MAG: cation diffusion facilitator family transporter [Erythrobacter sp.]
MGTGHSHSHHDHGHGHHGHSHAPADFGRSFAIAIALNAFFVVVEATYGFLSGSMALVADAGHNLSDVLALILAWVAHVAAKKPPSAGYTYGYKSSTILAAIGNAMLLAIAIGAILFETIHRMFDPVEPQGMVMVIVASLGIVINAGTAMLFMRGQKDDLNIRGAYLHMAADAVVSLGVVIAGLAIIFTQQAWIDPVVSLIIVAAIAWGTWGLAKDSLKMGLLAVPDGIDEEEVRSHLKGLQGVRSVEDLHIWPMSTTETAMTAHLVMPDGADPQFLRDASDSLNDRFGIGHTTIQIERAPYGEGCC